MTSAFTFRAARIPIIYCFRAFVRVDERGKGVSKLVKKIRGKICVYTRTSRHFWNVENAAINDGTVCDIVIDAHADTR